MRPRTILGLIAATMVPCLPSAGEEARDIAQTTVFSSGTDGYHTFRIPSILVTPKGTVLAICEGRKGGRGDAGDIDLVLRRSRDGGATWSPLEVIADDGPNTMGNPCPVVDRDTGTLWMAMTHNLGEDTEKQILDGTSRGTRTVWMMKSTDDGASWSKRAEITAAIKAPNWTWYATGPGIGIQTRAGRLVIPCDHYLAGSRASESHAITSDDHGASWQLGGTIGDGVNECQVAELGDGSLVMNLRNQPRRPEEGRAVATSRDGGKSWTRPVRDPALVEPGCQAGLLRVPDPGRADGDLLLFSNPASLKREAMTVRASRDGGKSWPHGLALNPGPAAYSCLALAPDNMVLCLYEQGEKSPYERITLARFPLDRLMGQGRRP
jgi:sialidase-1